MAFRSVSYFPEGVFPLNMGEEAAFERVFLLYHAPLRYFCEHMTGEGQACEDIVSQLFITLWKKQVVLESAEHAQAYLYRGAKNACLNYIRGEKRALEKIQKAADYNDESSGDFLDAFIRTEVWAELYRAVEGLPSQCCKVITKSYMEGMSNQEIADDMGISLQTVKNYKVRGLNTLKERLPDTMFILLAALLLK